ncbi:hypothetical protein RSAG8_06317, partial [Rhizoctonia solani AG-8 WAC10335]
MNFLEAYTSYPTQSSANPFALFGMAQSPSETCKAYRATRAHTPHSHAGFEALASRNNLPLALDHSRSSVDSKSKKHCYTASYGSRASSQSWLGRRRDALKRLF